MYPGLNIVCYPHCHYPCQLLAAQSPPCLSSFLSPTRLSILSLWNLRTHWCKRCNLHRLKLKFSHCDKSSCPCFIHRTPITWLGLVCTYGLSLPGLERNNYDPCYYLHRQIQWKIRRTCQKIECTERIKLHNVMNITYVFHSVELTHRSCIINVD